MDRQDQEAKAAFDSNKQDLLARLKELDAKLEKESSDHTEQMIQKHSKNNNLAEKLADTVAR
jgi:hypothetical protein